MHYPGEKPNHLSELLKSTAPDELQAMREKLTTLDTDKLQKLIPAVLAKNLRIQGFLANQELTKRGVPPCFRDLSALENSLHEEPDSQLIDLDWIANRYPENQKDAYQFFGRLFNPWSFDETAKMIWQEGKRPMWKIVLGLSLSIQQQWQCHYVSSDKVRKQRKQLAKNLPEVITALKDARFARGLTLITPEENKSLQRWINVWQVAHLADWRPTETARLYTLKTGEPLSRQMASKLLMKLERDLWKFMR